MMEEERRKLIKEIIYTIGRIEARLKMSPLMAPDGRIVMMEELPKLKELLEKVV